MTLDQFIAQYSGKKIDFDGYYGGQCVDLFRQYCKEVLELSRQPKGVEGAADFWFNYETDSILNENFIKIPNTPDFKPIKGDIPIWNKKAGGGFGHIAVVSDDKATLSNFWSFDQNWRALNVCEITKHTYTNLLGVFRFKEPSMDYQKLYEQARKARDNWWLNQVKLFNAILPDIEFKEQSADSQIVGAIKTLKEERKESESLRNNVRTLEKEMAVQNTQLTAEINKLIEEKEVLQTKLDLIQRGLLNPVPEPVQEKPKPIEEKPEIPQEEPQKEEYSSLISLVIEVLKMLGITKKE